MEFTRDLNCDLAITKGINESGMHVLETQIGKQQEMERKELVYCRLGREGKTTHAC